MAARRSKPTAVDDELGELFEGIDNTKAKKSAKPSKTTASKKKAADQDILADLENELSAQPPSRPHTPARSKDSATKVSPAAAAAAAGATKRADIRKSTDSSRSYHAAMTPSGTSSEAPESDTTRKTDLPTAAQALGGPVAAGAGWWGGMFATAAATASATASAAMKQAEGVVTNIQQSDEAKRWTEQVKGNVGALRGLGDELRHRAIPTFTNILHTLAPPISQHERLRIHITHDFVGYPTLDPLIYAVFSRVMSQVEGGDLMVIQRGQESTVRRPDSSAGPGPAGATTASQAGWRDGPWWRQGDASRDIGLVSGLPEGSKLCRVSAESYSLEFFAANGGVEQAKALATEPVSEANPVRSSDLFLAVQAIKTQVGESVGLFASSAKEKKDLEESPVGVPKEQAGDDDAVCFAVYVLDPVHELGFGAVSQAMPANWLRWLDGETEEDLGGKSPVIPASVEDGDSSSDSDDSSSLDDEESKADVTAPSGAAAPVESGVVAGVPDEIAQIVGQGGVDPREWVSEWIEESIELAVGIVAQRYVARRMGVGEGGIGRGKRKVEVLVEEGGGEAARAGLI